MLTAIGTGLIVFVVVLVFLFVARRVFRLALKLALVGVLVVFNLWRLRHGGRQ